MVVEVEASSPVLLFAMVNDTPDNLAFIASTASPTSVAKIHDAAFHVLPRLNISSDAAIVSLKLRHTVVPVDGHREGISDEETEESPLFSFGYCYNLTR